MAKSGSKGSFATVDLDHAGGIPVYRQIVDQLRADIAGGHLTPSTRLASTRTLASEWGVSRNTVLQVFEILKGEGYLESRVGDGTYVTAEIPEQPPPKPEAVDPGNALKSQRREYPFRRLSRRGHSLMEQCPPGLTERPAPFMPDVPDLRAFPIRTWLRLMSEVSGRLTGTALVQVSNAGYEPLREAIAHHLRTARGLSCTAAQVIVTSGSQQGLDLVTRMLLDRGDPVWIEEPGYVGVRASLLANGCHVLPVPIDDDGLDVAQARNRFATPRMICVSPARQYPLGATLSPERRQDLVEVSHSTGAWILEDDYDSETRYAGHLLPALQSLDRSGRVIHMGTFSKTLLPSFRLGFLLVPTDIAEDFAKARAVIDRHAPIMEQMVLAEFMHRGLYAAHLRRMRALYRDRQQAMISVLRRTVGYRPPAYEMTGGMHLVVPLRDGVDDVAVARDLWDKEVIARPLSMYYAGRAKRPGLLLGFAAYPVEAIEDAGRRLARLQGLTADDGPPKTEQGPL